MLEKIAAMLSEQLNIDKSAVTAEARFKEDLGADSLDLFELVMNLEEEYSIELPAEELADLTTVGSFIEYITAKGIQL